MSTTLSPTATATTAAVAAGRRRRARRRVTVWTALGVAVVAAYVASLLFGQTYYTPGEVARVVLGETVPGASFTVGELRLPRATLALLAGFSFGIGGAVFQTMLRNPLASPDIIGITWGASAAAVVGIVLLGLDETAVSALATVAGLGTALLIYGLSYQSGVAGTRLILIGIGCAAMLQSVVSYVLSRAAEYDLQTAMQWLTGSLNNATWEAITPLALAFVVVVPVLVGHARRLEVLRLGEETASALGVPTERTRLVLIVGATGLLAFATAAAGPVAFVAFLSGPIAARVLGPVGSTLVPAGLVGALLVLLADLVAQYATDTRFPVGVVTGVLGAPYLVYLLVRANRSGGTPVTDERSLLADGVTLGYADRTVVEDLSLEVPAGRISVIVGANACGKSTVLKAMARLLKPRAGTVLLDGRDVHRMATKEVARSLGLLPQSPIAPEGITVADLVSRGRHPHHGLLARWSSEDDRIVAHALDTTGTADLADRAVDELSGGQRQRVWIAMALAQDTDLLLLDEPTTFLDINHQVEVLDLLTDLNQARGTTIVMVLHDLNLAARYADHLVAVHAGAVLAAGSPESVLTQDNVERVFGLRNQVIPDPTTGKPLVLPLGRHHVSAPGVTTA